MKGADCNLPRANRRSVLGGLAVTALSAGSGFSHAAFARSTSGFDSRDWYRQDYRIVQTNLREIDAREKPDDIARAVIDFGGNVIVSNIGGIVAFYPTGLQYHYRNPYLQGDFAGEMIEAAHARGMAYLGRFDLAKGMKPAFDAHPEWFSLRRDGQPREYNGTYQACPNGGWMQEYGIEILREALTRYRPDGVFFNGIYFPSTNWYNAKDEGICTCENCRRAFRSMYGRDLPRAESAADPAWTDYLAFQRRVVADLSKKIDAATAPLLNGAPIMGRSVVGRGELQRNVHRPQPEWPYQGGEQSRQYLAANPGKPWSATSASFIDYPWRQVTESADYHVLRLAQVMSVGGHLDLYLMGTIAAQDDPTWLDKVSQLFKWRAVNSAAYDGMVQNARIGLYDSGATRRLTGGEGWGEVDTPLRKYQAGAWRGAYMMLVDGRLPFQLVNDARVADGSVRLNDRFDVLYLPNTVALSPAEAQAIDAFVENGGLLIATGMTGGLDVAGTPASATALTCLPTQGYDASQSAEGWSLDPAKGTVKTTGRVPIDGPYYGGTLRSAVTDLLPFAPDQRYGPPELSYAIPDAVSRTMPGVALRPFGNGNAVQIPWHIDWLYYRDGLAVHQQIISGLIAKYAPEPPLVLTGDGAVELIQMGRPTGQSMIHLINYAGQRNGRYNPPPCLSGLSLGVKGRGREARALVAGSALHGKFDGERTWYELPPLGAFEALLMSGQNA